MIKLGHDQRKLHAETSQASGALGEESGKGPLFKRYSIGKAG
jgi:hypothetical protein